MNLVYQGLLLIHVIIGFASLLVFWLPLAVKKGGRFHKQAGMAFALMMYLVSATAFVVAIMLLIDPIAVRAPPGELSMSEAMAFSADVRSTSLFLLAISVLVMSSVTHGLMTTRAKLDQTRMRHPWSLASQSGLIVMGIILGFVALTESGGRQILFGVFAVLCTVSGTGNLRFCLRVEPPRREWMLQHLSSMIGAGIGSYTAFFVFGGNRYLEFLSGYWQLVPWIAPGVIGGIAIALISRHYRDRSSSIKTVRERVTAAGGMPLVLLALLVEPMWSATQAEAKAIEQSLVLPGSLAFDEGRHQDARNEIEQALRSHRSVELLVLYGRVLMALSDFDEAADQLSQATKLAPESVQAHFWSGRAHGELAGRASIFRVAGIARKSRSGFERARELDPLFVPAYEGLITYYANAPKLFGGGVEPQIAVARELEAVDERSGIEMLVDIYRRNDRVEEALSVLGAALPRFPDSARLRVSYGLLEQGRERYERAFDLFQSAINTTSSMRSNDYYQLAAIYQWARTAVLSNTRHQEGIQRLNQYLAEPHREGLPSHHWANFRLGWLMDQQGQKEEAALHYALARGSGDPGLEQKLP
ncbi:MAG: tetratricopeptide repeat protein [Pseudomonadota bacterium]